MKSGELVVPDCKSGVRNSMQVPVWNHPIRRHWRDNLCWWAKDQIGIVIELWEASVKDGDTWIKTGYKYKIMTPNGIIGWVEQSDIVALNGEK